MLQISGTSISMTRGDTAKIQIELSQSDGTPYTPGAGDVIRFAVKRLYTDTRTLLKIDIPTTESPIVLEIKPTDTKKLPYGTYKYDIQLTRADGTVDTFVDRASFVLTEEIE